jgi:Lar family restriction alleviation protein
MEHETNTELLACPFCGVTPSIWEIPPPIFTEQITTICCKNYSCAVQPFYDNYRSREEAIKAWNTRPDAANRR